MDENPVIEAADAIYEQQHNAFKLYLSFGVILINRETGEYRYFRVNDTVLNRILYISGRRDLRTLTMRLRRLDLLWTYLHSSSYTDRRQSGSLC